MRHLLDQLNSRDPDILAEAMRQTRALTPDDLLKLLALERQVRVRRERLGLLVAIGIGVTIFVLALPYAYRLKWGRLQYTLVSAPVVLFLMACYYKFIGKYKYADARLAVILQKTEDARFVPHLLRLAVNPTTDLSHQPVDDFMAEYDLKDTVKRLLPQVHAQDAVGWSKADKAALLLPLADPRLNYELALACLKALSKVGDRSAIPAIKMLWTLEKEDKSKAALRSPTEWKKLLDAASECLLCLESGGSNVQQAESLLRSSDASHVDPDILLRPATGAADNSTGEQLLRPVNSENAP